MMPATMLGSLRRLRVLALAAGLLAMPGCASYQVTVPDSDPIQLEGQEGSYVEKTMNAYFWGLVLDPQVLAAECQGQGINDVVIDRTLGHDVASVFTLGIWMPMDVRFRCKAPPTRGSDFPE
jgi:Bor protein